VGYPNLRRCGVESHRLGSKCGNAPGDLPFAAPHVKDPTRPSQKSLNQREDLLFVFGIGTLGEALLPPRRVLLPEGFAEHQG
jgi:hypothetical protein